jgi:hypothetical protein
MEFASPRKSKVAAMLTKSPPRKARPRGQPPFYPATSGWVYSLQVAKTASTYGLNLLNLQLRSAQSC